MGSGIGAVVVTYRRPELLAKTVCTILQQTVSCSVVVIVNNDPDGPSALGRIAGFLTGAEKTRVIELRVGCNAGSAGGFKLGIQHVLDYTDCAWIWTMDDDYFPEKECLLELLKCEKEIVQATRYWRGELMETAAIDMEFSNAFRIDPKRRIVTESLIKHAKGEWLRVAGFSFEGTLFRRDVFTKMGLPLAEFFICHDDLELSLRAKDYGYDIYLALRARANREFCVNRAGVLRGWKGYYAIRNYCFLIRKYGHMGIWWRILIITSCSIILNACHWDLKGLRGVLAGFWDGVLGRYSDVDRVKIVKVSELGLSGDLD